jgi:molybdate transport system substrate-binding protein
MWQYTAGDHVMKRWTTAVVMVLFALGLAGCLPFGPRRERVKAYVVHLAQAPFQKLADEFEQETGIRVQAEYACRRSLGRTVIEERDGDLYVNANAAATVEVKKAGLAAAEPVVIAHLIPAIVVMKGNPKGIASVADLAKPGVRLCLGDPKGCLGSVGLDILKKAGVADKAAANVVRQAGGEFDVARSVDGKAVDATIVWGSVVLEVERTDVELVPIPAEFNVLEPVEMLVLNTGRNKAGAARLAAFLQSPRAQKLLAEARLR